MDSKLKQRLIGAIVLIALAVIFLPMLIKGPAPDSGVSDVSLKTPDAPDGQFVEIPLNAVGDVPEGGVLGLKSGAQPATPAPVEGQPEAAPAADAGAAAGLPEAVAAGDYAVNFGAYASQADADQVVAMLKRAQLPGYTEPATVNGRQAVRVRIGPYADRAQAEIVRLESLKVRSDVKAQVVALNAAAAPPVAAVPAPAPTPAEPRPVATTQPAAQPVESRPAATAPKAETKPAAAPKPAEPKPAATAAKPAEPKPAATAAKPAEAKPAATGYAVQVGAFADANQATVLRDQLRSRGFSAFVEKVNTDNGVLNRVRVGPVATREAAEALQAKVGSGQVRPHP